VSLDAFATSAGAYVLGALTPAERQEFVAHLADCPACAEAVEDLAGLPGLLARVPVEDVLALDAAAPRPAPGRLLPGLLQVVARERRRRRWAVASLAAAAAAAVVAALVLGPARGPDAAPVAARPMQALVTTPITATVDLEPVAWGTRLDLRCRYPEGYPEGSARRLPYALVVTDLSGRTQTVGTWTALPGRDAALAGATSWSRSQIAAVEVTTLDGLAVLRLDARAAT
jgi:Putative zinc-finger